MTDKTMWPDITVDSWHDFIRETAKILEPGIIPFPTYLFLGQPDANKMLVPTLLRHFPPDFTAGQAIEVEQAALNDFRSQAHLHYPQGSPTLRQSWFCPVRMVGTYATPWRSNTTTRLD